MKSMAAFSRQALPSPPPKKRRKLDIDNLSDDSQRYDEPQLSSHCFLSAYCLGRVRVVKKTSEALKSAIEVVEMRSNTATDIKHAIENLERDTMGEGWYAALQGEFKKSYFRKVKIFFFK